MGADIISIEKVFLHPFKLEEMDLELPIENLRRNESPTSEITQEEDQLMPLIAVQENTNDPLQEFFVENSTEEKGIELFFSFIQF